MFAHQQCWFLFGLILLQTAIAASADDQQRDSRDVTIKTKGKWKLTDARSAYREISEGKQFEVKLRGWLVDYGLPQLQKEFSATLDIGETSWQLDVTGDTELAKLLSKLNGRQVMVHGVARSEPITLTHSVVGVTVKSIDPAEATNENTRIEELEVRVDILQKRMKSTLQMFAKSQKDRELEIALPEASEAVPLTVASREIVVAIDDDGKIRVDKKLLTTDQLEKRLHLATKSNSSLSVIIQADKRVEFRHVTTVMNTCNKLGIHDYSVSVMEK